jgi:predicted nuclease of restriction endonuclease-like (RecB) superfamily
MPKIIGKVPWGQHVDIVSRCQLIDGAMFYVNNVVNNGWSRPALNANIDANLFQAKGTAVTNFKKALPSSQEKIAKEILKDPYHFEFLKMQEKYEEGDLEDALIANVTQFLLELGNLDLKVVKYTPEFAGKLNFYVTAADELLRGEGDNPSVGLIICKSTDKTVVEWSLKDINKPLGVATY